MAKVNIVGDAILKYTDEDIIAYLAGIMTGVSKNYQVALEKGHPEVLWANIGDIALATNMLRALKKRNDERLASAQK